MENTPFFPHTGKAPADGTDMTLRLSDHFTLREFCLSATAISRGLDNTPDALAVLNLRLLCQNVLEPLRRRFGVIRITSGYRSIAVNNAVGGAEFSQHRFGQAADIHVSNHETGGKMYDYIRQRLPFDQLIYEYNKRNGAQWIHVSFSAEQQRRQAFMEYRL